MKCFDKPLTAEEEREILEKYFAGDGDAKQVLIQRNMRLVAHMTKRYVTPERELDDLISVGTIGLIKAVNTFKPDKKIRFATYAAKCIDNELLMMIRAEKKRSREVSMYEPVGMDKEGNEISIIEIVSDENTDVVEDYIFNQRIKCIRENMDKVLTKREKIIIINRYGFEGCKELTQLQIAKELGISRSYVSRIEKRALDKLKQLLEDNNL